MFRLKPQKSFIKEGKDLFLMECFEVYVLAERLPTDDFAGTLCIHVLHMTR